jgi:hypothetical protein
MVDRTLDTFIVMVSDCTIPLFLEIEGILPVLRFEIVWLDFARDDFLSKVLRGS